MTKQTKQTKHSGFFSLFRHVSYVPYSLFIFAGLLIAIVGNIDKVAFGQELGSGKDSPQRGGVGYLGVYLGDVNEERARKLGLSEVRGAVVGKIEDGSPASRAGLREHDVILIFNDKPVQNRAQFYQFLIESRSGSKVTLGISRNGEPQSIPVELGVRRAAFLDERRRLFGDADAMLERAEELRREAEEFRKNGDEEGALDLLEEEKELRRQSEEIRASVEDSIRSGKISRSPAGWYPDFNPNRYYLGIIAVPLTEQLANYFKVARGVLVSEVRAGGAAEQAGVRAGDCIIAVNSEPVTSTSDLNRLIDRLDEGRAAGEKTGIEFYLNIVRDRNEQQIKIKIEQR